MRVTIRYYIREMTDEGRLVRMDGDYGWDSEDVIDTFDFGYDTKAEALHDINEWFGRNRAGRHTIGRELVIIEKVRVKDHNHTGF